MDATPKDLFDAGVHFGHQLRRWNPKSKPYVYANINGISIIDLEQTHALLEKAYAFIEETVASGKEILFIGTKSQAQEIMREAATARSNAFLRQSLDGWRPHQFRHHQDFARVNTASSCKMDVRRRSRKTSR